MVSVGFRFNPTEEELVSHYLKEKILGHPLMEEGEQSVFAERNLYGANSTPWEFLSDDLPWQMVLNSSNKVVKYEKVLYIFTTLTYISKKNSKNGKHKNRVAGCGSWNVKSGTKLVKANNGSGRKIGESKRFTFESKDQTVGQWTMTEYSIDAAANGIPEAGKINPSDFVLCKIKRDDSKSSKGGKIVSRKRKNENIPADEVGQSSGKTMIYDDDYGTTYVYKEGTGISGDD